MEQTPSWEISGFSSSQEIPYILRNPAIQQHIHKNLPFVPVLIPA